jgi:hypothetical protein
MSCDGIAEPRQPIVFDSLRVTASLITKLTLLKRRRAETGELGSPSRAFEWNEAGKLNLRLDATTGLAGVSCGDDADVTKRSVIVGMLRLSGVYLLDDILMVSN